MMQVAKYPIFLTLAQGLAALFRKRTWAKPMTALCFFLMALIFAGVLILSIDRSINETFLLFQRVDVMFLPVLAIYSFWLYRHLGKGALGHCTPLMSFAHFILFSFFMVLLMFVFALLGGVCIFLGVSLFKLGAGQYAQAKAMLCAAPAIIAGLLLITRFMPGFAAAARGEGVSLRRVWGMLHGNFWRFLAVTILFNLVVGYISLWLASFFWGYGQQFAMTHNYNEPMFYVSAVIVMVVHLWNTAGVAFITSRAYDIGTTPVAGVKKPVEVVAVPAPVAKKPAAKKAAVKKSVAKKPATKKGAAPKKAAAKKVVAKKPAAKKKAAPKKAAKK